MRICLVVLLLTGCVSAEQRAQNIVNYYGGQCERMGIPANTDQWRECIVRLRTADASQPVQMPYIPQPQQPRTPIMTNCRNMGGVVSCTSQ